MMGEGLQRARLAARATQIVAEDDPSWLLFWSAYPLRVSKIDARKAWSQCAPTQNIVEQIVAALAWQVPLWVRQGYGMPYPASWLRAERWTDEPPVNGNGRGHAPVFTEWTCPHVEDHASWSTCEIASKLNRPRKAEAV